MNKNLLNKIYFLIIILVIIVSAIGCTLLSNRITDLEKENKEKSLLLEQKDHKEETNNKKRKCDFIRTLNIVSVLDDYDVDPDYMYVVVDQFQMFEPHILKISRDIINVLEVGKSYEFLFNGDSNLDIEDLKIISCIKTDKEGLDQIQESCY